jgi:hypothetical protein
MSLAFARKVTSALLVALMTLAPTCALATAHSLLAAVLALLVTTALSALLLQLFPPSWTEQPLFVVQSFLKLALMVPTLSMKVLPFALNALLATTAQLDPSPLYQSFAQLATTVLPELVLFVLAALLVLTPTVKVSTAQVDATCATVDSTALLKVWLLPLVAALKATSALAELLIKWALLVLSVFCPLNGVSMLAVTPSALLVSTVTLDLFIPLLALLVVSTPSSEAPMFLALANFALVVASARSPTWLLFLAPASPVTLVLLVALTTDATFLLLPLPLFTVIVLLVSIALLELPLPSLAPTAPTLRIPTLSFALLAPLVNTVLSDLSIPSSVLSAATVPKILQVLNTAQLVLTVLPSTSPPSLLAPSVMLVWLVPRSAWLLPTPTALLVTTVLSVPTLLLVKLVNSVELVEFAQLVTTVLTTLGLPPSASTALTNPFSALLTFLLASHALLEATATELPCLLFLVLALLATLALKDNPLPSSLPTCALLVTTALKDLLHLLNATLDFTIPSTVLALLALAWLALLDFTVKLLLLHPLELATLDTTAQVETLSLNLPPHNAKPSTTVLLSLPLPPTALLDTTVPRTDSTSQLVVAWLDITASTPPMFPTQLTV